MSASDDFAVLNLPEPLARAVAVAGWTQMTEVQARSLPSILAARDVIAEAKTGSGKTAAFALGILARVNTQRAELGALVLCPTRELADQVSRELRKLARFIANIKVLTLCGGVSLRPHLASLAHTPHVVVGTPGRLLELIERDALPLARLHTLVLDEADRMLDMGFADAIGAIIERLPRTRQTLLFSATLPEAILATSARHQRDPVSVRVASTEQAPDIEQRFIATGATQRSETLARLLATEQPESALVFVNTRLGVRALADDLTQRGFAVLAMHGDLDQREREEMLVRFANASSRVLIATDVAARGLDIVGLPLVVNFELASDAVTHVHRIGRTGRAGASGLAVSLVAPEERARAEAIAAHQGRVLQWHPEPPRGAAALAASHTTLAIDAGRVQKLRAGDILGALTGDVGLPAAAVGRIDIYPTRSYVAIVRAEAGRALNALRQSGIKGRTLRVRMLASGAGQSGGKRASQAARDERS